MKRRATTERMPLQWQGGVNFAVVDERGDVVVERLPNQQRFGMAYSTRRRAENGLAVAKGAGIDASIVERPT